MTEHEIRILMRAFRKVESDINELKLNGIQNMLYIEDIIGVLKRELGDDVFRKKE